MQFVVVELKKFNKRVEELGDNLESWCFLLKNSKNLTLKERKILEQRSEDMPKALERLEELSSDEDLRTYFDLVEKARRDQATREEEAEEKGMEKGMEKGRAEVALKLIKKGLDSKLVSETTGLSEEEIKKLSKK